MEVKNISDLRKAYNIRYLRDPIENTKESYEWIIKLLNPQKNKILLDIACGIGPLLRASNEADLIPFGIDISDNALEIALENGFQNHIALADAENLPFADNTFDYVVNLGSLEHFLKIDVGIKEMVRVMKPDGIACVMVPNFFPLYEILHTLRSGYGRKQNQDLERFYCVNDWRDLINSNGLKVEKIFKYNGKGWDANIKRMMLRFFTPLRLSDHFVFICYKI